MKRPTLTLALALLSLSLFAQSQVTLHLHAPTLPDTTQVFVAGNQAALGNWNPARVTMASAGNHNWTLTFEASGEAEYKYTLGTWGTEGLGPDAKVGGNLRLDPASASHKYDTVHHWLNGVRPEPQGQVTGTVRYHLNVQPKGLAARNVVVWLPPGYSSTARKRYPVLYMHDGQNVFDPKTSSFGVDWQADETCTRLIQQGNIPPIIIVAVYCNGPERREEYSPGTKGTAYMDFLIHQLKPMIDSTYRTQTKPKHTYVGGSSMGGLISFMLVWEHPEVFSKAICMSPAFQFLKFDYIPTVEGTATPPQKVQWYIDNGGMGLERELQPGIDAMFVALREKGYRSGKDYFWYQEPEAEHNEAAWAKRLPIALKLLIGRGK